MTGVVLNDYELEEYLDSEENLNLDELLSILKEIHWWIRFYWTKRKCL